MSHDHALQLQKRLEIMVEQFEGAIATIEQITTQAQIDSIVEAAESLQTVLTETKTYFTDVRDQLTDVPGIPPAKELAQLAIGASTEALSAIRETKHNLEDLMGKVKDKRRVPISRDEIHYAEFSAKVAIRRTKSIISRIQEQAEDLPEQL